MINNGDNRKEKRIILEPTPVDLYQEKILEMINNISEGIFDVDDNGYLKLMNYTKHSIITDKYSQYYRDLLIYGIQSANTINISIASDVNFKNMSLNLDNYGQGLTIVDNNEAYVYISGLNHISRSGTFSNSDMILAHELAGHAIPSVTSSYNHPLYDGLAVTAENIIRAEIGLPLRKWGAYEKKHNSVNSYINPIGRVVNNYSPLFYVK